MGDKNETAYSLGNPLLTYLTKTLTKTKGSLVRKAFLFFAEISLLFKIDDPLYVYSSITLKNHRLEAEADGFLFLLKAG